MHSGISADYAPITLVVCSRQRPHQLQRWVAHVIALLGATNIPVLVIEQSSVATTLTHHPRLQHIHAPGRGLSRARNHALQVATTPFVAFCDDDCFITAPWLDHLIAQVHAHPGIAVMTGSTWPHGSCYTLHAHHTHAGYTTWASRDDGRCCTALHVTPDAVDTCVPVPILERLGQGNHMLVDRHIAIAHGGFHPWLGAGAWLRAGEDVEFMLRLLRAGQRCVYAPQLRITHDAWQTPAALARAEHGYTTGMLAVHLWYALAGEGIAHHYLRYRIQRPPHLPSYAPPRPRSWRWMGARAMAWVYGIVGGVALAIAARWRSP